MRSPEAAPLVGFGATPQLLVGRPFQRKPPAKGAGSEASLPVTLRSRRSAPQAALSITCTLSRPLARPQRWSSRHSMTFPQAGDFASAEATRGNGNGRSPRSPLGNLRCTLPYLTFIGSRQIFGIRTSKSTHKSAFSGVSPPFIIERRSFDEKAF